MSVAESCNTLENSGKWTALMYLSSTMLGIFSLVIWIIRKEEDPFLARQGKELLNLYISFFIWWLTLWLALCVIWPILSVIRVCGLNSGMMSLSFGLIDFLCVLFSACGSFIVLNFIHTAMVIRAAFKVQEGVDYVIPYTFRFLK